MNQLFFNSSKKNLVIWLGLLCLLIVSMISLGGYTRLTNSGLSITEWKPVTGIVPPMSEHIWQEEFNKYQNSPEFQKINNDMSIHEFKQIYLIEYAHRVLGRIIALTLILPFLYFTCKNYFNRKEIIIYIFAIILLLAQGVMGWYMVKSGLVDQPHVSHYRLSTHLLLACLLYTILLWQFYKQFSYNFIWFNSKETSICFALSVVTNILILFQITIGGLVAGLKAGLIYNQFPLMGETFVPEELAHLPFNLQLFSSPVFVQFLHRISAYLISFIIFVLYFKVKKLGDVKIQKAAKILLILTIIQIIFGVLTLLNYVPIDLAMLHQLMAIILLSSSLWLTQIITKKNNAL